MTDKYGIHRFLYMYRHGTLDEDATWRAYDFMDRVRDMHVRTALKMIGLGWAGEHGVSQFAVLYEVPPTVARSILGAWWLWSQVSRGRRIRGLKIRAVERPREGSGATTLAPDPPEAA